MSIQTCPTTVIRAPAEKVWVHLTTPTELEAWTGARLMLLPTRPLMAGDSLVFWRGIGGLVRVSFQVLAVEPPRRLALLVFLPFGVVNKETILLVPLSASECRVTFN